MADERIERIGEALQRAIDGINAMMPAFRATARRAGAALACMAAQMRAAYPNPWPALERPVDRAGRLRVERAMRLRARRAVRRARRQHAHLRAAA